MNKPVVIFTFLLLISLCAKSQNTLSSDDLFENARTAAFKDKDYDKARQLAYQALQISPSYADIDIFLGRIDTWSNQYDSARYHFTKVLVANPANEDASIAYTDLEYWNNHYTDAINICDSALKLYPNSEELLIRKAKILYALKDYHEAGGIIKGLLKRNNNNTGALALATKLKDAHYANKITASYDYTAFDKQYSQPWQLGNISYSRYTKLGSVIARVNYANRFGSNGVQGEVDAYPHINKTFYSYVNFGYSGNVGVFPKFRAGFSLYANLPHSFEAEAGVRYLYFTNAINIYTAYIGKYYKNFLFSARTYITPSNSSISQSYTIAGRYYFKGADDYIGLTMGTGISPDDNNQNVQLNTKQKLSSKKISADFSHTFLKWNIISLSAGLINQEYLPTAYGNQIDVSLGISRRF